MDEPTRGIDVGAKADVFRTMRRLADDGLGIVFVTSDLEEVMALSDRILVMSQRPHHRRLQAQRSDRGAGRRGVHGRDAARRPDQTGNDGMTSRATTMTAPHAAGRGRSLALALMRMRTFIALIVVFVYLLPDRAELPGGADAGHLSPSMSRSTPSSPSA